MNETQSIKIGMSDKEIWRINGDGVIHREDGPAIIHKNGTEE